MHAAAAVPMSVYHHAWYEAAGMMLFRGLACSVVSGGGWGFLALLAGRSPPARFILATRGSA